MPQITKSEETKTDVSVTRAPRGDVPPPPPRRKMSHEFNDRSMAALRSLTRRYPEIELTLAEAGFEFPPEDRDPKGVLTEEIRYGSSPQYRLGDKEVRALERVDKGDIGDQEKAAKELDQEQREKARDAVAQARHDFPERQGEEMGKMPPSSKEEDKEENKAAPHAGAQPGTAPKK